MHPISYFAGTAAAMSALVFAVEPTRQLDENLAARLINLQSQNRVHQIQVAMILEGASREGPVQIGNVRRVIAVHPVLSEGRQVRRMQTYDFNWSPTYGWFLWEKREERGGDAVWIWSENLGEIAIR